MDAYVINIKDMDGTVEVRAGDMVLGRSSRARLMAESVVGDSIYLPRADVRQDLLVPSTLRTFCPFKGTASYWSAALPQGVIENVAWSYDRPLPEADGLKGYIGFDAAKVSILHNEVASEAAEFWAGAAGEDFTLWLLQQSFLAPAPEDFCLALGRRLIHEGMALRRINISLWTLHPEFLGQNFIWSSEDDAVQVFDLPIRILENDRYRDSPTYYVTAGLGGVRQRLDDPDPEFEFPIMADLRAKGCSDYVAMPLHFSDGSIHVLSLAGDATDGFSTAELGKLFMHSGIIARILEVHAQRRTTASLLQTYLGERSAKRVLAGASHRGDGEIISAAILYCDLRNSTALANAFNRDRMLGLLNAFFEAVVGEVNSQGGEVLKFIGDAVLAIFPVDDEKPGAGLAACEQARRAAIAILAALRQVAGVDGAGLSSVIALHFGTVQYGNVGAPGRLDYTVTGTTVHETARIQELCKTLDEDCLISEAFAQEIGVLEFQSRGAHQLRGFETEMQIFALADEGFPLS